MKEGENGRGWDWKERQEVVRRLEFVLSKCEQAVEQEIDLRPFHLKKGSLTAARTADFGELGQKQESGYRAHAIAHTRGRCGLGLPAGDGTGETRLDSGCVPRVEPTDFANEL